MLFRGETYPERPHSVAVYGTSPGSIGGTALDVLDIKL